MKKVILNLAQSLDGFICRPDGTVDFLGEMDQDNMGSFNEFLDMIDVVVMGNTTYQEYKGYGFGYLDGKEIYVWTKAKKDTIDNIVFYNKKITELIKGIKNKTIWCFGGTKVIEEFMKHDLIDEYHITTVPHIIGTGKRLFTPGDYEMKLEIVDSKYENGMVTTIYKRMT